MKLPRAILFDLDDTILIAFGQSQSQSQRTIAAFADQLGPIEATTIAAAIQAASTELWADPTRHQYWRHRIVEARRRIVSIALAALAAARHPVPPEVIGHALADAYNALHDEELSMLPDAHETLDRLKELKPGGRMRPSTMAAGGWTGSTGYRKRSGKLAAPDNGQRGASSARGRAGQLRA